MVAEELKVIIEADTRKARSEMDKYKQSSDKVTDSTQKTKGANLKSIVTWGAVAGAITGVIKVAGKLEDAYRQQEQAESRLQGVLRATGEAAGFNQQQLQDMAAGLQQVTTFGDEAILEMQSLLLTFKGIQGDAFERTTALALDLSAVMGTDLKSSALQLGKALEDPATGMTALRRVGVSFTDAQKEMIVAMQEAGDVAGAQGEILDILEGQVGGVAETMADTATGAADQLSNTWGDFMEVMGKGLSNTLRPAREELNRLLTGLIDLQSEMDRNRELRTGEATNISLEEFNAAIAKTEQLTESQEALQRTREEIANTTDEAYLEILGSQEKRQQRNLESLREQLSIELAIIDQYRAQAALARNAAMEDSIRTDNTAERLRLEQEAAELERERQEAQDRIDALYNERAAMAEAIVRGDMTQSELLQEQIDLLEAVQWQEGALETQRQDALKILRDQLAGLSAVVEVDKESARIQGEKLRLMEQINADAQEAARLERERAEALRESQEAMEQMAQRAQDLAVSFAADTFSAFGDAIGGGGFDAEGFARSAVVGITEAFAPGFGELAGGLFDMASGIWDQAFGATKEELDKVAEEAKKMQFELQDVYKTEAELRREYVDDLRGVFSLELEVLRDQFERGIFNVDEFVAGAADIQGRAQTAETDGAARAQAEAAADLQAAKSDKAGQIQAQIDKLNAELNNMGWEKLWSGRDEEIVREIAVFEARKKSVADATTLAQVTSAAQGADFMTNGPQLLLVGDNASGRERVMVDPAPGGSGGDPMGGATYYITVQNAYGIEDLERKLGEVRNRLERRGLAHTNRRPLAGAY